MLLQLLEILPQPENNILPLSPSLQEHVTAPPNPPSLLSLSRQGLVNPTLVLLTFSQVFILASQHSLLAISLCFSWLSLDIDASLLQTKVS